MDVLADDRTMREVGTATVRRCFRLCVIDVQQLAGNYVRRGGYVFTARSVCEKYGTETCRLDFGGYPDSFVDH